MVYYNPHITGWYNPPLTLKNSFFPLPANWQMLLWHFELTGNCHRFELHPIISWIRSYGSFPPKTSARQNHIIRMVLPTLRCRKPWSFAGLHPGRWTAGSPRAITHVLVNENDLNQTSMRKCSSRSSSGGVPGNSCIFWLFSPSNNTKEYGF